MKKNFLISSAYIIFFLFLIYSCIVHKSTISAGVSFAISYSLQNLIPSLFPMIFLSCAINNSPAKNIFSSLLSGFCRKILRLPSCCACSFLFGLCLGYPVGAKLCSILLKNNEITPKEASRLLLYCINPGFPFCVIYVGGFIFDNLLLGFYIFISTSISSIILGFICGCSSKSYKIQKNTLVKKDFSSIISESARQSLDSTLTMCLYICIFSAFIPILQIYQIPKLLNIIPIFSPLDKSSIFYFFFEVTNALSNAHSLHSNLSIFVFGLSFAGICIHLQVFSMFPEKTINYKKFYISRLSQSILSVIIFKIVMFYNPIEISISANLSDYSLKTSSSNYACSFSMIILACAFIYLNKSVENKKNL